MFKEMRCENVHWFHWAQNGYSWRAVVNTVMNLRAS